MQACCEEEKRFQTVFALGLQENVLLIDTNMLNRSVPQCGGYVQNSTTDRTVTEAFVVQYHRQAPLGGGLGLFGQTSLTFQMETNIIFIFCC